MSAEIAALMSALMEIVKGGAQLPNVAAAPAKSIGEPVHPIAPYERGNIDLYNRPHVVNPDGRVSTVRSMSFMDDSGKEILIPTVSDDGRLLSEEEAIAQYYRTRKHLGLFQTPRDATRFAERLHNEYQRGKYGR